MDDERKRHLQKQAFRTRIRVVKWGDGKAEVIEFGGHYYRIEEELKNASIVFNTAKESTEFSAMASAMLKALEPEGG